LYLHVMGPMRHLIWTFNDKTCVCVMQVWEFLGVNHWCVAPEINISPTLYYLFLSVLGIELKARQVLYHLTHDLSPFCF
jgi:putative flippase GtrA